MIARASSMRFKGGTKEPVEVAGELNVRYVLDGSVRRAGPSLRLTARLIDCSDGSTVWSDKLGGTVEDVFAMQERLSRTIVDALRVTLSPREDARLRSRPIDDVKAYEYYLQARQLMYTFTIPSLDRAAALLEAARARAGESISLLTAIGGVHLSYVETGQADLLAHLQAADECADRIAAIDPDSFGHRMLRGWIAWKRGHIREAIASLSRAHDIEPNNSDAAMFLSLTHLYAGQDDKAREFAHLALQLDPLTPLFQCMPGFCDVMAGRPAQGVAAYRRFCEMDPANPVAHSFLLWVLVEANHREEATAAADRLAREFPGTVFGVMARAYGHALRGDAANGQAVLTPALRIQIQNNESMLRQMAGALTMMGDHDGAIDALEQAAARGLAHYPYLARYATVIAPLRPHPRFQKLLEIVKLRWERGGRGATD